jgi:hypothetical protein
MSEWDTLGLAASQTPPEFWKALLSLLGDRAGALETAALLFGGEKPRVLAEWKPGRLAALTATGTLDSLAAGDGLSRTFPGPPALLARAVLRADGQASGCWLVVMVEREDQFEAARQALGAAAAAAALYQSRQARDAAEARTARLAKALEITLAVGEARKFQEAALTLCNRSSEILGLDRMCLGWLEAGQVRLQAISRMDKLDRKMDAADALERVMEECADQNEALIYPPDQDAPAGIFREHGLHARARGLRIVSVPLTTAAGISGVLLGEAAANSAADPREAALLLQTVGDNVTPLLKHLRYRSAWWGRRLGSRLKEGASHLLGPRHTLAKLSALAATVALFWALLYPMKFWIEAPFTLESPSSRVVTAPFDGYLEEILVEGGQTVEAGAVLVRMKRAELLLEQKAAEAEFSHYSAEAEKARASLDPSELRIAESQARQAAARLEMVNHRLSNATVVAREPAIVLADNDLGQRLEAAVKAGEPLLELGEVAGLVARLRVDEKDIDFVAQGARAELRFVTQPETIYRCTVNQLDAAAEPRDGKNNFLARAVPGPEVAQPWWRPGMTGVCRVEAGRRPPLVIAARRLIDWLRLNFWI